MSKNKTFNVCYLREYRDPENECETFNLYETIYRNVPMKYLKKFTNKDLKMKMLKHCDWNYKETAKNFENVTNIDIVTEKDYYTSFADVYGDVMSKDEYKTQKLHMWHDYGQQYDRGSLRKDFNPAMTKSKVYSYNGKKCH
jgi:hypothetical protein